MLPEDLIQSLRKLKRSDAAFAALFRPNATRPQPELNSSPYTQLVRQQGEFEDPVRPKAPTVAQLYWDDITRMF